MRPSGTLPHIGEGFAGEGANTAHVNIVLGHRAGPISESWLTALATPRPGHVPFVAVARPGVPVRPFTLFVNKATVEGERHGTLTWGAAQAGKPKAMSLAQIQEQERRQKEAAERQEKERRRQQAAEDIAEAPALSGAWAQASKVTPDVASFLSGGGGGDFPEVPYDGRGPQWKPPGAAKGAPSLAEIQQQEALERMSQPRQQQQGGGSSWANLASKQTPLAQKQPYSSAAPAARQALPPQRAGQGYTREAAAAAAVESFWDYDGAEDQAASQLTGGAAGGGKAKVKGGHTTLSKTETSQFRWGAQDGHALPPDAG